MKICEDCFEFMPNNTTKLCPYCKSIKIGEFKILDDTIPGKRHINRTRGGIIPKRKPQPIIDMEEETNE